MHVSIYIYMYIYMYEYYVYYVCIHVYIYTYMYIMRKKESVTNLSACLQYLLESAMVKCKKNGSWTANIHGSYPVTSGLSSSQSVIQVA